MRPGESLGHYRIDKRLGVGGMGEVYLAVDTKLNRPVALKTLRKAFFSDPERHRRFIQEARAASALDHPHIVTIYDISEEDGVHFIVMQYVAGESLGELIRAASAKASAFAGATADKPASQGLDLDQALDLAVQMADGLARAHRDGIVHRDLKPDNVMVSEEGRAKIVDFGLAKLTEPPAGEAPTGQEPTVTKGRPLTREGEILGTGAYMSPEQALGKEIDARSDIFSFGSVLYEMVTGQQAFSGESVASVLAAILRDEPEPVSRWVPAAPAGLENVIERALRKDREERFQSMEELRQALLAVKKAHTRTPAHSQIVQIGDFEVDLEAGELRKQGHKVKLQGKPFQILALLLERPGRVVSREELFKKLWPSDTFVDFDNSVNAAINKLRGALGDSADNPRYVETIPRRGYRFIGSVQFADGSQSAALKPFGLTEPREVGVRLPPIKYGAWVGFVLVIALAVVAIRLYPRPADSPASTPQIKALTSFEGAEYDPALSPDGSRVAFTWDGNKPGGATQLYVKVIDGAQVLQLTDGPEWVLNPAWSPDGRQIAFLRAMDWAPNHEVFVVSALGGQERRVGTTHSEQGYRHKLAWSPGGESLAFAGKVLMEPREAIFLLALETGETRRLTSPALGFYDSNPRFSPDGETVAFVRKKGLGWEESDIFLIPARGGEESRLTSNQRAWGLDWSSDGREIYHTATLGTFVTHPSLWRVSRDGGEPQKLPFGEGVGANMVTLARNGNLLAYAASYLHLNLWRVGGPTADPPAAPERLIGSTYWDIHPQYSPDGSRVAFTSTRSGDWEVWICDGEGDDCGSLTVGQDPAWSPDGTQIAFTLVKEDSSFSTATAENPAIYVIEVAGGLPRGLTSKVSGYLPSWSRDGRFIYFGSRQTGRSEIWRIAADGGEAQQITKNGGVRAAESEDGRFVYFARHPSPRRSKIWKVPVEGGEETLVLDEEPDFRDWATWGGGLVYLNPEGKDGPAIEFLDLDTKEIREVVPLPNRRVWGGGVNVGLTVSPDGRWVVFTQLDGIGSDLMLVENFR